MIRLSPYTSNRVVLRTGGAFAAVFALAGGLFVLYVVPSSCSFVGSIQLILLGFLFLAGITSMLIGQFLLWKKRRRPPV